MQFLDYRLQLLKHGYAYSLTWNIFESQFSPWRDLEKSFKIYSVLKATPVLVFTVSRKPSLRLSYYIESMYSHHLHLSQELLISTDNIH